MKTLKMTLIMMVALFLPVTIFAAPAPGSTATVVVTASVDASCDFDEQTYFINFGELAGLVLTFPGTGVLTSSASISAICNVGLETQANFTLKDPEGLLLPGSTLFVMDDVSGARTENIEVTISLVDSNGQPTASPWPIDQTVAVNLNPLQAGIAATNILLQANIDASQFVTSLPPAGIYSSTLALEVGL